MRLRGLLGDLVAAVLIVPSACRRCTRRWSFMRDVHRRPLHPLASLSRSSNPCIRAICLEKRIGPFRAQSGICVVRCWQTIRSVVGCMVVVVINCTATVLLLLLLLLPLPVDADVCRASDRSYATRRRSPSPRRCSSTASRVPEDEKQKPTGHEASTRQ